MAKKRKKVQEEEALETLGLTEDEIEGDEAEEEEAAPPPEPPPASAPVNKKPAKSASPPSRHLRVPRDREVVIRCQKDIGPSGPRVAWWRWIEQMGYNQPFAKGRDYKVPYFVAVHLEEVEAAVILTITQ